MLMVVNPFDVIHSGFPIVNVNGQTLTRDMEYYVLDTDDLQVEQVSYTELQHAIESGVVISNISQGSGFLFISDFGWTLTDIIGIRAEFFRGRIIVDKSGDIEVNGRRISLHLQREFSLDSSDTVDYVLNLVCVSRYVWNDKKTYSFDYDLLYFYKLNDYLVIRISVELNNIGGRAVSLIYIFSLIVDFGGEVISFIPDSRLPNEGVINRDPVFTAKYLAMQERKY